LVLASLADATLLVARYGMTNRVSLARSHRMLIKELNPQKVGIVLNGVSRRSSFHYEYYGCSDATPYPGLPRGNHANG
jgi:polysaccharide biosynthesis transport protein